MNIFKWWMYPEYRNEIRQKRIKSIEKSILACERQILFIKNEDDLVRKRLMRGEIGATMAASNLRHNQFALHLHTQEFNYLKAKLFRLRQKV